VEGNVEGREGRRGGTGKEGREKEKEGEGVRTEGAVEGREKE
jgi:hypothetical protein